MYETKHMRRVLELAQQGMSNGHGGPFGCVIVKNGEVVGEAHNEVLSSNDPTAHAELLAVRRASAKLKTFNLVRLRALHEWRALLHVHVEHAVGPGRSRLLHAVNG